MANLPFYILDVFAEQKYAGNQLAVFRLNAPGRPPVSLSSADMLALAREMHFSETTFITSETPERGGYDVRIFTPGEEVPFAGHPTLGTAHVIHRELLGGGAERVVLNLKVGQVPVTFTPDGRAWMQQVAPTFGPQHAHAAIASIVNLPASALDDRFPVEEVSTGLPFFIVPLKRLADLQAARVNRERHDAYIAHTEAKGFLLFCPETHEPAGAQAHDLAARVFVDYYAVPEDPATGSANGCLAAYLARHRYFGGPQVDAQVEQGYEINRPSLLLLRSEETAEGVRVEVGGRSVIVARGEFE